VIVGSVAMDVPDTEGAGPVVRLWGSLLVMVIRPESFPAIVRENDRFDLAVPFGAIVLGVAMPETPTGPPPTEFNETMLRLAPPALININLPLTVCPTASLARWLGRLARMAG
jgi:hypothetical protein